MTALRVPITFFANRAAKSTATEAITLQALVERIRSTRAATKAELPLLKLASFGDARTPNGSLRSNANVAQVHGVEVDYDGGEISVDTAIERLRGADLTSIVYTSPSATPEAPRWRILCPTSESVAADQREALVARLNGLFAGQLAGESFVLSQAFYYGAPDDRARTHRVELVEGGRTIEQAGDLDVAARYRRDPICDRGSEPGRREADVLRVASALHAISNEGPADWNEWSRIGMAVWAATDGTDLGHDAFDAWSQRHPAYDEDAVRERWEHWKHSPPTQIGAGTVFHLARQAGWQDATATGGSEFVADLGAAILGDRRRLISASECSTAAPRGYVVKGLLAPRDLGCIFGAPGAGKSLLAPHLGYAVAQGRGAFSARTKPGPVVYVAAEDPHGMQGRVAALRAAHGDAPNFYVADGVADLLTGGSADLAWLREVVEQRQPSLVFIDTLAMAFPGLEENSAEGMGRVVAAARSLTLDGAAVVLIHHDTKADGGSPRGHSLLNGALDMALRLEPRDDEGIIRGRLTKNRNGSCDLDLAFRIGVQHRGLDEDGDPIGLPYTLELDHVPARAKRLSPIEQKALKILKDALAAAPDGSVEEAAWRAACRGRISDAEAPKVQGTAFRRAARGLEEKGRVVRDADTVRLAAAAGGEFTGALDAMLD